MQNNFDTPVELIVRVAAAPSIRRRIVPTEKKALKSASLLLIGSLLAIAAGSNAGPGVERAQPPGPAAAVPSEAQAQKPTADPAGLHNLMKVTSRIYSGSEPHGEEGIASLQKLGVKTIVSVDGAKPQVALARKYGMRYVHIPIGYDGVHAEAGQMLARFVREAEGPFYIHCHHGKHRGPAAAAVACVAAGDMNNKEAREIMVRAGTSKDYAGLWRDVEAYIPPPGDAQLPELVEVAEVGSFAAAMSQVDRAFDNVKLCRDAKWTVPADHPDIVPTQEALLLQEGLHEAGRNLGGEYDEQFKKWLADTESLSIELRSALQARDANLADERALLIEKSCKQCHTRYRDN
jgi:protein tyrosine phosphatase (PTP) superfamily phosphohydrolase (DUF442 family)